MTLDRDELVDMLTRAGATYPQTCARWILHKAYGPARKPQPQICISTNEDSS